MKRELLTVGDKVICTGYVGEIEAVHPDQHGATYTVKSIQYRDYLPLPAGFSGGKFRAVAKLVERA